MTDNGERLLGELAIKLDTVNDKVDDLKGEMKAMRTNCPTCTSTLAVHAAEIATAKAEIEKKASSERVEATEKSIDALWKRVWTIGLACAGLAGVASYIANNLK